jgi:hypothetical protein
MKILFVLVAASALFAQSVSNGDPDQAAIRTVVTKYVDAREHMDAAAIRSLFTADADQLVSSGEWRKGREQLYAAPWAVLSARAARGPLPSSPFAFPRLELRSRTAATT